jgi:hypothetical protein
MKIGIYSIPDLDPQRAVGFAKVIYEFPNHKMTEEAFSSKTDVSIKGGWFGMILLGLRSYGLITAEKGMLSTTELMAKLLYPKTGTTELQDAKDKVFESVPLWKKLYSEGLKKTDVEKDDFWVYLSDLDGIRGVDREKVKNKASLVQKGYILALAYKENTSESITPFTPKPERLKTDKSKTEGRKVVDAGRSEHSMDDHTETVREGREQMKFQIGGVYIEIIKDDKALENIENARDLLEFMGNKLRKQNVPS